MKQKIKVWDAPTRIFHWMLVLAVIFMWYSADAGGDWLLWHIRCGLLVAALLVFRLCWGFWGSDTARFANFVRGPQQILRYLKGDISDNEQPGHNPLGALMVLALIAVLLVQATTGLFSPDNNTFVHNGYLNILVGDSTGSALRKIHLGLFNLLAALAAMHIVAVLAYKFFKKQDLIKPMLTGYKELEGKLPNLKFAGAGRLAAALLIAVALVYCIANFAA